MSKFNKLLADCIKEDQKKYGVKGLLRHIHKGASDGPSFKDMFGEEANKELIKAMSKSLLTKHDLVMIEAGNKQSLFAYTDYPLTEEDLKEQEREEERISSSCEAVVIIPGKVKPVTVLSYDRDKYCLVLYKNEIHHIKSGYLYDPRLLKREYKVFAGYYYQSLGKKIKNLPYLVRKEMGEVESLKLMFRVR